LVKHAKTNGISLKPIFFFYAFFPKTKAHSMLCTILGPHCKGLGIAIQFLDKERTLQIASEYNHQVLLPLLISAYKFLNPSDVGVGVSSFTSYSAQPTSLHNLMETNEEITSSVVKELLNHFRFKKVTKEEAKNPLELWKMHEVQFLYFGP